MEDLAQTVRVSIPLKSGLNCRHNLRSILHGELCLNPFEIRAELPQFYIATIKTSQCLNPFEIRAELPHHHNLQDCGFVSVSIPLKSGLNCRRGPQQGQRGPQRLNPFEIRAELPLSNVLSSTSLEDVSIPLKSGLNCRSCG